MSGPFKPDGYPSVIPRIVTPHVAEQVAFVTAVFGATGELEENRPTELQIGDSIVMVSDGGGMREPMAAFLYVYVPDVDAAHRWALELGATSLEEPEAMPWGDRRATFRDPWGNVWQPATRR